ncbi:uncharacterized protein LOC134855903, partial [Symsagittifera roscoffensis]|uniref:uncharacterized protein LOC134855903 n=1 Tax=Symsagittifera roscoffensis TaxID=84072 RepID=UPI00307BC44F
EDKGLHCFNLSGEGSLDKEANVTVKLTVKSVSGVVEKQGHTLEKAMNLDEVMLVPSMGIMGCVEYDDSSGCHLLIEVEPFKFLEYLSFQYTLSAGDSNTVVHLSVSGSDCVWSGTLFQCTQFIPGLISGEEYNLVMQVCMNNECINRDYQLKFKAKMCGSSNCHLEAISSQATTSVRSLVLLVTAASKYFLV